MTMQAVQLIEPGRPLEDREVDVPRPGRGQVVVAVRAAGICHSDVHYRAGFPDAGPLPIALGHEVAGEVLGVGDGVDTPAVGDRVAVHYQLSCGDCALCRSGGEQLCTSGAMIGKSRPGGYAEQIVVPARNLVPLPDAVPYEHGAIMMCSSATAYHALRKGRLAPGENVAVFGVGGLGSSAVQLASAFGAATVYGIDINPAKLELAERLGATPVDASARDPVAALLAAGGVDVALDLVGSPHTMAQAVATLGPFGRAVAVGITDQAVAVGPYTDLVAREAEMIGSADHLYTELAPLLDLAARGRLVLDDVVSATVPLRAQAINETMDALESFGDAVRTVIVP